MSARKAKAVPGVEVRHSKKRASRTGARCDCDPTYQAHVYDARSGKRIRKTFASVSAAKLWRQDALVALRRGTLAEARPKTSVKEVSEAWLADARAGVIRTRSGHPFKPATLRAYEQTLRLRVYPTLATAPFYRVRRIDLQNLVDRLIADGAAPATVNTMLGALGAVYGRAVQRDEIEISPTIGVKLLAVRNGRERFATPQEAADLIAAAPERDRAVWATAIYAGLRRGELMALRWGDVDLTAGTITVERGWDEQGPTTTKTGKRRTVPIVGVLRDILIAHRLRQPPGVELVFGQTSTRPFRADRLQERADAAWRASGLARVTPHDCRHTFASIAIAAGVNAKALSTYMGHSSVAITLDRYGHLFPGNEAEAAGLLDAYLEATA